MTYEPGFDKCLREGEAREDAFVDVLLRSKVEHKSDRASRKTGNIAIEYQQRCRDGVLRGSGITITQAGRYAVEFDDDCWLLLPTERVKDLARRAIREGRHRWIGDGNNHHNALIPFEDFHPFRGKDG